MKRFPTLFKKSSLGKIEQWSIEVSANGDFADIITHYGELDGRIQKTSDTVKEGKNTGKANATSAHEQALKEAQSKYEKKLKSGYVDSLEKAQSGEVDEVIEGGVNPMLAHSFAKSGDKITYPCAGQPKLDGCVHGDTELITDTGVKTIRDIVDNRLQCSVLSYNKDSCKSEFKPVTNWFNNGEADYRQWVFVTVSHSQEIKCTINHKIHTNNGWKRADELDPKTDKLLADRGGSRLFKLMAGTLLGDTCLAYETRRPNTPFSYRIVMSHANEDLLKFKAELLGLPGIFTIRTSGYGSKIFVFTTKVITYLDFPVDKMFFTENGDSRGKRKCVTTEFLREMISLEALSLWIADDGSLNSNNGNKNTPLLSLHTEGYSEEQVDNFIFLFQKSFGCTPKKYVNKKVKDGAGIFLTFSTKDTLYLLNQLRGLHCRGVEYKYYFPTEGYIPKVEREFTEVEFTVRHSKRNSPQTKYDIEVKDNHNYFANNILVHNCRAIAIKKGENVTLWTRTRKPITSCPHIVEAVQKKFKGQDVTLDGELYHHDYKEEFEKIVSAVRKENPTEESAKVQYHIYDCVNDNPFMVRSGLISRFLSDGCEVLKVVPTVDIVSEEQVAEHFDNYIYLGYEGLMLRNLMSPYENKRSYHLQKVKEFDDAEFEIVGVEEGRGKLQGLAGAIVCKTPSGETFKAKPMGDQESTRKYVENPDLIIGKMLTVKYQGLTGKNKVPRFPAGVAIRDYE